MKILALLSTVASVCDGFQLVTASGRRYNARGGNVIFGLILLAFFFIPHALQAGKDPSNFIWSGRVSSSLLERGNWERAVPVWGMPINDVLHVTLAGVGNELVYSADCGTTSFLLAAGNENLIGQNGTGILTVTGGTLNFKTAWRRPEDGTTECLWIGNGAASGEGTLNLLGGELNCASSIVIGRDGASGTLNISGGKLTVADFGINIGNIGAHPATSNGRILLSGSGKLVLSGPTSSNGRAGCISFRAGAPVESNYIDFQTGGSAALCLLSTADNFPDLLQKGFIRINCQPVDSLAYFKKTSEGPYNVYRAIGDPSSPAAPSPGRLVAPVSDRLILLLPEQGEVVGNARLEPGKQGGDVLGNWSNSNDWIKWKAKVPASGIYNVSVEYSCASPKPAATVEVAVGFQGVQAQLEPTGNWENTCRQYFGQVQLAQSGEIPINVNVIEKHSPWVMNLYSVRLVRTDETKLAEPPKAAHRGE